MTTRKAFPLAIGCVAAVVMSLGAADYYVDSDKGSNSNEGTSSTAPLLTLQAAVDKAPSGSTIHVAPGVYREGSAWDGYNSNRVYVTKSNIAIVADKGNKVTFIEGRLSELDPSTKCGSDSMRAVRINGSGSYIRGFTIRNGSTVASATYDAGSGGAVYGGAVIDCVITNCATSYRGMVYSSVLISSLLYKMLEGNYDANACKAYNCVFKGGAISYGNGIVLNCTYTGDGPRGQSPGVAEVYNSYIAVARPNTDLHRCYYLDGAASAYTDGSRKITADEANLDHETWRPKRGSVLIDAGNDDYYDSYESAYKAAFSQYDFAIKPRLRGASVDIGAVEYDFAEEFADALSDSDYFKVVDSSATVWTNDAQSVALPSGAYLTGVWANPSGAVCPSEVSFAAEATEDAVLNVYLNGGEEPTWTISAADGVKTVTYLSGTEDTLKFVCEDGASGRVVLSAFTSTAHECVYADAVNGNDDWDGSVDYARRDETAGHGPTRSLQRAVNLAAAGSKVYAATGVYDRVETWYDGCSNRLAIGKANLGIIAIGPQSDTVIEGALDSSNANGCGPAAVRCVYFSSSASGSYVRGFTLTKGRTANVNSDAAGNKGAALYQGIAVDCAITNCGSGYRGTVNNATAIRCKIESATSGSYALYQSKAFNCVNSANYNYGAGPYVNCSFLLAAPQGQGSAASQIAQLYNCYVYGSRKWGAYHRCYTDHTWNADSTVDDDCKLISASLVALDATTRRPNSGSALVDAGSDEYYAAQKALLPAAAQAFLDEDFAGGQRVYNGAIDIGAGERDWRGDFAARLKHSARYDLAVANASPMVTTNALGGVTMVDGTTVAVDWTLDAPGEISFSAVQSGEGTLSVTYGGVPVPVAIDPTTHRGIIAVASGGCRLVFAFSGGGSVALSDFRAPVRGTIVVVQ